MSISASTFLKPCGFGVTRSSSHRTSSWIWTVLLNICSAATLSAVCPVQAESGYQCCCQLTG